MTSTVNDVIFSESSGGKINAVIAFVGALIMLGMYIWYGIRHTGSFNEMLILAVGLALMGLTYILPADQRRITGVLRIVVILIFIGQGVLLIFAQGLLLGT